MNGDFMLAVQPTIANSARSKSLLPGTGAIIAVRSRPVHTTLVVSFHYTSEGFRFRLARWLGPTRGGKLVPALLRTVPMETVSIQIKGRKLGLRVPEPPELNTFEDGSN